MHFGQANNNLLELREYWLNNQKGLEKNYMYIFISYL